jgi:uncharacterized protein YggE
MRNSVLVFLPLLFCSLAFGQVDSNSITVSASRNASLQPDQAIFAVTIQSGVNTGLDDVLAALQGSGITAANLSSVSSNNTVNPYAVSNQVSLQWTFSLTAPLTNTKATVASLTTLQQNITKLNNGLTLSFSIVGTQISQQLAQSQTCSLPGLVADATAQAQSLASAGGLTLGAIVAMSGSTSNVVTSSPSIVVSGSFSAISGTELAIPPCAITVRFNVTRYQ